MIGCSGQDDGLDKGPAARVLSAFGEKRLQDKVFRFLGLGVWDCVLPPLHNGWLIPIIQLCIYTYM